MKSSIGAGWVLTSAAWVLLTLMAQGDSVDALRIRNKDAPVIDGVLDPIWKQASPLRLPADAGNYYKFGAKDVMKLEGDVQTDAALYRKQAPFTIAEQRYADTDPSSYSVYFLHDDLNLYVAVVCDDDRYVESSEYDQTSDAFGLGLRTKDGKVNKYWLTWFRGKVNEETDPTPSGPPLDRERMCYDAEWSAKLHGTWNESKDSDKGFVFEFYLPLETLGDYAAGEKILANIIMVDHDQNPLKPYNDRKTQFMKTSWGSIEDVGDLSVPNHIVLGAGSAFDSRTEGYADLQNTLVARSINPADAPVVNGLMDDAVWKTAYTLYFPNPVGRTWTMSKARYNQVDPSIYRLSLLHDGSYFYVGFQSNDRWIESAPLDQSDVDQESDGLTAFSIALPPTAQDEPRKELRLSTFWYKLDAWGSQLDQVLVNSGRKPHGEHFRNVDGDEKKEELHFRDGPPRTPYALDNDELSLQWGYSPMAPGEWNNPGGGAKGYSFEYRIPLATLGGLAPGQKTRANIVITDHDANPGRRYMEFDTRYQSFWWGTDHKDLWKYDASGKPVEMIQVPKNKERFIELEASAGTGTKGYSGRVSTYLNHFESEKDFFVTTNGDKAAAAIGRGYSGNGARIAVPAPASIGIHSAFKAVDLSSHAILQFVVRSSQPALPLEVSLKDASGKSAVVARRVLRPEDLAQRDSAWHKVALPVAEMKRQAPELDLGAIVSVAIKLPEASDATVDELAALKMEDALSNAIDFIAAHQLPATGLIRSFTGNKPAHTYDQAVALIALTDSGRHKEAKLLADTMIQLQETSGDQGFFYDSYNASDRRVGQGTDSGVGPNTWMAYALALYGQRFNDDKAKAAADRVCRWILADREIFQKRPEKAKGRIRLFWEKLKFWDEVEREGDWEKTTGSLFDRGTGGVWAAIQHDAEEGAPTRPDIKGHSHDKMLFWYSTEGVIDAQHLFKQMTALGYDYGKIADKIRDWMFRGGENSGWNDSGHFNLGHNDFTGSDTRIYLDTHTWGAILAKLHGQDDKAAKALAKADEMLSTRQHQGVRIRGFNDSRYPENESIWNGGTAHYIAACNYLGWKEKASEFADNLLATQELSGGWRHSTDFAYMTCFVRKSDGKVAYGYVDEKTGIPYDDPKNIGKPDHVFKPSDYPEQEWTGYGTYHNSREAVGETAWVYFGLKGYATGKPLPYPVKR